MFFDEQLQSLLVAMILLTGVIGALCYAAWEVCKMIKQYMHDADDK